MKWLRALLRRRGGGPGGGDGSVVDAPDEPRRPVFPHRSPYARDVVEERPLVQTGSPVRPYARHTGALPRYVTISWNSAVMSIGEPGAAPSSSA